MDKDMLLAKAPLPPGWIDMGIGEAYVVRQSLMASFRGLRSWSPSRKLNFSYQEPRGMNRLLDILDLKYGTPVTVTVGAKNGLFLIFKALKRMGFTGVVSRFPYWPSFPAMVDEAGLKFLILNKDIQESELKPDTHVFLVTSPNNPDSYITKKAELDTIRGMGVKIVHDAVYSTKAYGFEGIETLEADVMIFSAAKQFGLSGIRVGWVVTQWTELDAHLQDLTETITSGVCVMAQAMVADIISLMKENPDLTEKFYKESVNSLRINRENFVFGLGDSISKERAEEILKSNGMFIWMPQDGLNLSAKVRHVKGDSFGMPGWIRLNIGNVTPTESRLAGERLGGTGEI